MNAPGVVLIATTLALAACGTDTPEAGNSLDCSGFDSSGPTAALRAWPDERPLPVDLADSRQALDNWLDDTQRRYFGCTDLAVIVADIHFGLALWIRNNWSLDPTTPLGANMQSMGLRHPDDISNLIAMHYVYAIRGKAFDVDREVQHYVDYWNKRE